MNEKRTYLDETMLPYPFCPGCGHGAVLDYLDAALSSLELDPRQVVIVTDIGCAGLSDRFFSTNAFHGLHGRSITYATGMKLANPDLKVIVLIGDGGCGIGGHHLINAARRNIGVTVLVFNNLNYGMTGGEHSVTTPLGARTATTRYGNLERPMDICSTVAVNGAGFVARTTSFDKGLPDMIANAIRSDDFALIDIWELCTAYYVPNNRFSKSLLEETLDSLSFSTGIIHQDERLEYSRAYRAALADQVGQPAVVERPLDTRYEGNLSSRLHWVIAGTAGARIGSAAAAFCRGAVLSGLWATQRRDYQVTVRSGYSVAEVILSPEKIHFVGGDKPDRMVVLSPEGLNRVRPYLGQLTEKDIVYASADLLPLETRAQKIALTLRERKYRKQYSIMALAAVLHREGFYPMGAFREAVAMRQEVAEKNLAALDEFTKLVVSD